jgi:hypothetical protein
LIKIQGLEYSVEITPPGLHSNFIGQTLPDELRMMVSAALAPQRQESVLIHEITHMLVYEEPLVMSPIGGHEESEGFVSRLSSILYETLMDNDLLVDGWMEKLVDRRSEEVGAFTSNSKNVVEKNDDNDRAIEYRDESVRGNRDDATVLDGGHRELGRYSQQSDHQRPRGRRRS